MIEFELGVEAHKVAQENGLVIEGFSVLNNPDKVDSTFVGKTILVSSFYGRTAFGVLKSVNDDSVNDDDTAVIVGDDGSTFYSLGSIKYLVTFRTAPKPEDYEYIYVTKYNLTGEPFTVYLENLRLMQRYESEDGKIRFTNNNYTLRPDNIVEWEPAKVIIGGDC